MARNASFYLLFLLAAIYVFSCSVGDKIVNGHPQEFQQLPSTNVSDNFGTRGLPSKWVGRSVSELLENLGQPDLMIDTVPRGATNYDGVYKYAYVYLPKPGSNDQCVNAYVIDDLSSEVIKFYCR